MTTSRSVEQAKLFLTSTTYYRSSCAQGFHSKWDDVRFAMTKVPDEDTLENCTGISAIEISCDIVSVPNRNFPVMLD